MTEWGKQDKTALPVTQRVDEAQAFLVRIGPVVALRGTEEDNATLNDLRKLLKGMA